MATTDSQAPNTAPRQDAQPAPMPLSPVFHDKIHSLYQQLAPHFDLSSRDGFAAFLRQSQGLSDRDAAAVMASQVLNADPLNTLTDWVASAQSNILAPDAVNNLSHPLSHYFISTSHNTYLTGNQLYSESSVEEYKNVLLRGGRCVEIDVWDGNPNGTRDDDDDERRPSNAGGEEKGLRQRLGLKSVQAKPLAPINPTAPQATESASSKGLTRGLSQRIKTKLGLRPKPKPQDTSLLTPAQSPAPPSEQKLEPPAPWRSNNDPIREPRVLHGHTLTKEVTFRKVCVAIRDAAFVASDLPIIVSLEVHCCHEQQEQMVSIIKSIWGPYLARLPISAYDDPDALALPSPADLRRRILIKVKYTPPEKAVAKAKRDNMSSKPRSGAAQPEPESDDDSDQPSTPEDLDDDKEKKKKKPKMIGALCDLGIYTRAYHYKSFSEPEASIPTHVFSLSEGTLYSISAADPAPLFHHNAHYMMRCYPKATRIRSSNLTPTPFWRSGVQMVALNWQNLDKANMLNEGMFAESGGWVLKPETHRPTGTGRKHGWYHLGKAAAAHAQAKDGVPAPANPRRVSEATLDVGDAEPWTTKYLSLKLTLLAAQDLPLPNANMSEASFRPYFKISLHTEGLTPAADFADLVPMKSLEQTTSGPRAASLHPQSAESDFATPPSAQPSSFARHGSVSHHRNGSRHGSLSRPASISRHGSIQRTSSIRSSRRRSTSSVQGSGQAANKKMKHRTPTIHPHLLSHHLGASPPTAPDLQNYEVAFDEVEIDDERLCLLRVKVMDDLEMRRDEMAAWACLRLDRIGEGIRVLHLRDRHGRVSTGRVLVRVSKSVREVEVGTGRVV